MQYPEVFDNDLGLCDETKSPLSKDQEYRDKILSPLSTGNSGTSVLDQELSSSVAESNVCPVSPISSAPICRQFWKSGSYDDSFSAKSTVPKGSNHLHVHPKFLHSNATSHKWAFGAIAELIDNSIDEVSNGATYVMIDKVLNPRDGSTALLVQDDGGGMDPEAMRHCLSFGFSDKKSITAIGQYGNGFKTSSMRLGSDVIVFTRHLNDRKSTQSIGLLSYTFLMQTGHDRIVVPMVDYEFNNETNTWHALNSAQHVSANLSLLLQWSPYSSEESLLKQFDDIGNHGSRIIVFNLWHNSEGIMELDFESDPEDICISGGEKKHEKGNSKSALFDQHLANRLRFSLRAYLSVLYLRVPENFSVLLRGQPVEYYNIAANLKFRECILYKPQGTAGATGGEIITAIGFLKEAPQVNIHGFNVYHKNRLILPFWHVLSYADSRGRGVVGVLEANFIQPTHNKQDFEKTSLFQKLEQRLKEMSWEYWDYHCGLLGYKVLRKPERMTCQVTPDSHTTRDDSLYQPVVESSRRKGSSSYPESLNIPCVPRGPRPPYTARSAAGQLKRKVSDDVAEYEKTKRGSCSTRNNSKILSARDEASNELNNQESASLIEENKALKARYSEHERVIEELRLKAAQLRVELSEAQSTYSRMFDEAKLIQKIKEERRV